jgi:hypothetical protein
MVFLVLGNQNNDQPRQEIKRNRAQGIKTFSDPSRCNNDDLKALMEEVD